MGERTVARIFSSLAVVSVVLLLAAVGFGLSMGLNVGTYNRVYAERAAAERQLRQQRVAGEGQQADATSDRIDQLEPEFRQAVRRATWHMLVGILAGIVAILVNSISVTYFIGTSRWCKEVVETYDLGESLTQESVRYKRGSFPWALLGIVTVIGIVALGGAADPATGLPDTAGWALPHFAVALGGVALIAVAFLRQASFIQRNSELVDRIVGRVRQIRQQRGLDVEV